MKNLYFLSLLFLLTYKGFASHIVGGEISITPSKIPNSTHTITLNLYFDQINGRTEAEDRQITVGVFRRKDNVQMGTVVLPQVIREPIRYLVPGCEKGDLQTLFMSYSSSVTFTAENYNDPQGYYVVWERCCRNAIVTNIIDPGGTGMVFFTEFPPVTLTNSSPNFKKIVADYICVNQSFEMDFSATDVDGDSLVYSMVTPWRGFNGRGNATALPRGSDFYPEVTYASGINTQNQIPGIEPLNIDSQTGILGVTTGLKGLYVFSMMIEEFRNGKRIGRVKRDFQLKVIDCVLNNAPSIRVKNLNDGKFYSENQILNIKSKDKRCFEVSFTDPDVRQVINISTLAVNFSDKYLTYQKPTSFEIKNNTDSLKVQFCLDDCAITRNGLPIEIQFVVEDNGCPVPIKRRHLLRIQQEQAPNNRPEIYSDISKDNYLMELSLGESKKFSIIATELDGDSLSVTAKGRNFNFSELGWTFNPKAGFKSISTDLTFNADCDALRKQNLIQQANVNQLLTADFTVTDVRCGIKQSRTYTMIFKINAEKNEPPKVSTSLATKTVEYNINPQGNNEVKFNVIAEDPNVSQTINLVGTPRGFDFKSADMAFDNKSGKGKLSSVFSWTPSCKSLDGKESKEYFIRFSSVDNSCFTNNNDSLTIKLVLLDKSLGNGDVKPYNVFTPNGDGVNDYFTLGVVPGDNCRRQFKKFEIFNRWGRLIYRTEDRNFRWDGNNNPEGEYMYSLVFSDDTFKGILKIMK